MQLKPEDALRREVRGSKGRQRAGWIFLCQRCGKGMWVLSFYLKQDRTGLCKSCAASERCHQGLWSLRPFEALYKGVVRSAAKRNIRLILTYEEFLCFTNIKACHYCG